MTLPPFTSDLIHSDDILIFDYDGTLADFVTDPSTARVPAEVVRDLQTLSQRQPVIIISGRRIAELDVFLAPMKLPASGMHGRQFRAQATGEIESPPLTPMPEAIRHAASDLVALYPGSHIETKDENAFGFHVRPLAPEQRLTALDEFRAKVAPLLIDTAYKLQPGNMVLEVCPAGFDKGQAVGRFLSLDEYRGHRAVYFGDDLTDEYAFRKLAKDGSGFGVLIGPRALDPAMETAASYRLDSPGEMRAMLAKMVSM